MKALRGRDFLAVARALSRSGAEPYWRAAAIHAYFALLLECRDALVRWGRPPPPHQTIHGDVRLCFRRATCPDLRVVADALDRLVRSRNRANYDLRPHADFASSAPARSLIQLASDAIDLLDAIETDPARRAAAIASLPP
jgi:hypothetical protein